MTAMTGPIVTDLKKMIKQHLTCPKNPMCDQTATAKIYQWVGDNIVFTANEAENACQNVDGACDR